MKLSISKTLIELLRYEICGGEISDFTKENLYGSALNALYTLSKYHDLAHLVASALDHCDLLNGQDEEVVSNFRKQQILAVYRCERTQYELGEICRALEEAKIPHIPLKGAVMRQYYPEAWMRTSCDIDILIHPEDLERASEVLETVLKYRNEGTSQHDVSFFSESGVHLELHFDLLEEGKFPRWTEMIKQVWSYTYREEGHEFLYRMSDEMFYFYHIVHTAKHFKNGGCGIRLLLDLWLLKQNVTYDEAEKNRLLEQSGLKTFSESLCELSDVWFSGKAYTDLTEKMEKYFLESGVYGNINNRVLVQQVKQGGKFRYVLSRIFLCYPEMKEFYPILKKHRWLTPFYEVKRWFSLVFIERKHTMTEWRASQSVTEEKTKETCELLERLGLDENA